LSPQKLDRQATQLSKAQERRPELKKFGRRLVNRKGRRKGKEF